MPPEVSLAASTVAALAELPVWAAGSRVLLVSAAPTSDMEAQRLTALERLSPLQSRKHGTLDGWKGTGMIAPADVHATRACNDSAEGCTSHTRVFLGEK